MKEKLEFTTRAKNSCSYEEGIKRIDKLIGKPEKEECDKI